MELQIAGDWSLVPSAHNLTMRYHALKYSYLTCHMQLSAETPLAANASKLIEAADMLFKRLHAGTFTAHGKKRPLNGDIAKLQAADNLTSSERVLVGCFGKVTRKIAGSQALRPKMGHSLFGYRVNHGEGTFQTVSPNRRHSALLLRLHRARRGDTNLRAQGAVPEWRSKLAGVNVPSLVLPAGTDAEMAGEVMELPSLEQRQAINAQDPWSSVMNFDVSVRVILPRIMGMRMCFNCPHCNSDESTRCCQNKFGNNAMVLGGTGGMCDGTGCAVENQGEGSPHEHGLNTFVTPYQHRSLWDINELIEKNMFDVKSVFLYVEQLERAKHYNHEEHQAKLAQLEAEWKTNYAASSNLGMCYKPAFLGADSQAWLWPVDKKRKLNPGEQEEVRQKALSDAKKFKDAFEKDARYMFSRVQHHWHQLRNGVRVPLNYCAMKKKGKKHLCRSDFPLHKKCSARAKVVCKCVAKKHKLKISGRKNALGSIIGERKDPWFSATNSLCASILRCNTNIMPNFRVPITKKTIDCDCECLKEKVAASPAEDIVKLCIIAQRAMKQMTGYFTGYISKKQKLGGFELKAASSSLPFLEQKLKGAATAAAQVAQVTNRLITTLEGKGVLRSAPESFNLCGHSKPEDQLFPEFIRTFRSKDFNGSELLGRLELVSSRSKLTLYMPCVLPPKKVTQTRGHVAVRKDVDLYGFRGKDPRVYYLSPWEFCTYWYGVRLEVPSETNPLTCWTSPEMKDAAKAILETGLGEIEPGVHYTVNDKFLAGKVDYVVIPKTPQTEVFRDQWVLRKWKRPVVPCPEHTPLPKRGMPAEDKAKICSVYLRPWTLDDTCQSTQVPHLRDLNLVVEPSTAKKNTRICQKTSAASAEAPVCRSFRRTWKSYIRGRVVSDHGAKIIKNFLLSVMAEGRHYEDDPKDDEKDASEDDTPLPGTSVQRIHEIIDSAARQVEADTSGKTYSKPMRAAMQSVESVLQKVQNSGSQTTTSALEHCRMLGTQDKKSGSKVLAGSVQQKKSTVEIYQGNVEARYKTWLAEITAGQKHPTAEQMAVLDRAHRRYMVEFQEEACNSINGVGCEEPLLELIHGLPGSGKSTLIGWLCKYFKDVWWWEHEIHFVCLAPMNGMASNIGGCTAHSWGEVGFMKGDVFVESKCGAGNLVSSMSSKCQKLRTLIIDEIENMGGSLLATVEDNVRCGMPDAWYKKRRGVNAAFANRLFGGANVLMFGDFWQLPPVGEVAVMGNPFRGAALYSSKVQRILQIFWSSGRDALRHPATELSVNQRSGADAWHLGLNRDSFISFYFLLGMSRTDAVECCGRKEGRT